MHRLESSPGHFQNCASTPVDNPMVAGRPVAHGDLVHVCDCVSARRV